MFIFSTILKPVPLRRDPFNIFLILLDEIKAASNSREIWLGTGRHHFMILLIKLTYQTEMCPRPGKSNAFCKLFAQNHTFFSLQLRKFVFGPNMCNMGRSNPTATKAIGAKSINPHPFGKTSPAKCLVHLK